MAYAANIKVQVLEGSVLGRGNEEKTSRRIRDTTG